LRIEGREHLPQTPNFVLVANHASHLDTLVLGSALNLNLRNFLFPLAAGDVFFQVPAMAAFSAGVVNALPIWRKNEGCGRAIKDLRQRLLEEPTIFVLFPEGTRSRDGQMASFKPGIGMLVASTPFPIIPCYIEGAHAALPAKSRFPKPHPLRVRIGQPRFFADVKNRRAGWEEIAQTLEHDVRNLAPGEMLGVPAPPTDNHPQ
jgi:1-acyl-sn-glycerol-3-phosphate acyltransferase